MHLPPSSTVALLPTTSWRVLEVGDDMVPNERTDKILAAMLIFYLHLKWAVRWYE